MILAIWWEPQAVGPGARTRIELMAGQSHVLYQVTPRGIRETRHAKFPRSRETLVSICLSAPSRITARSPMTYSAGAIGS